MLYQGFCESPGSATNSAWTNDLNEEQGFRTTKSRIVDGVGQRPCKSGVRRDRTVQPDQVGSALRLWTDGGLASRRSGAGVGSHSTVTCRTTDGAVRRSSNPCCTVLIALPVQKQHQASATSRLLHAQQGGRYTRPKDNGFVALLASGCSQ